MTFIGFLTFAVHKIFSQIEKKRSTFLRIFKTVYALCMSRLAPSLNVVYVLLFLKHFWDSSALELTFF